MDTIEMIVPLIRPYHDMSGHKSMYLDIGVGVTRPFKLIIELDLYGLKRVPIYNVELLPLLPPTAVGEKTGQKRSSKQTFPGGSASVTFAWRKTGQEWRQMNGILITYNIYDDKDNVVANKLTELNMLVKNIPKHDTSLKAAHEITTNFDFEIASLEKELLDIKNRRLLHLVSLEKTTKENNDIKKIFDDTEKRIVAIIESF